MLLLFLSLMLPLAQAGSVQLQTADGLKLQAETRVVPKATIGVLFAHQLKRTHKDWSKLAERMSASGFTTIAPDLRGHGASAKSGEELAPEDYKAMEQDLNAALAWLRSKGVKAVSCVGASIGANLCAQVAAKDPAIVNLVLLSPGLNYKGITSGDALTRYGERPVLIVASDEDRLSKRASSLLEQAAKGQVHYELLRNAGHGTQMLTRAGALIPKITSWLVGSFKLMSGEIVKPKALISYDGDPLKSTGKKLQIHQ
jgi:pimeloyl-ACP methyl ester carboxylesterase